ncbi:hypothetical protein GCM10028812_03990 [Ancylobacter sonchi]
MALDRREIDRGVGLVVDIGGADIDADALAAQPRGHHAGAFQRLPHHFEQQPLLRVDLRRLARGDAEHAGVEAERVVEIAAGEGVAVAGSGAGMQEAVDVPAPDRLVGDGALALGQNVPEFVRRLGAREPAGISEDRHFRLRSIDATSHPAAHSLVPNNGRVAAWNVPGILPAIKQIAPAPSHRISAPRREHTTWTATHQPAAVRIPRYPCVPTIKIRAARPACPRLSQA